MGEIRQYAPDVRRVRNALEVHIPAGPLGIRGEHRVDGDRILCDLRGTRGLRHGDHAIIAKRFASNTEAGNSSAIWAPTGIRSSMRCRRFKKLQALFNRNTYRSWRTWGITGGMIPWDYGHGWDMFYNERRRKNLPTPEQDLRPFTPGMRGIVRAKATMNLVKPFQPGGMDIYPAGVALMEANSPTLAWIAGGKEAFTSKDHSFAPGQNVKKQVVLINDERTVSRVSLHLDRRTRRRASRNRQRHGSNRTGHDPLPAPAVPHSQRDGHGESDGDDRTRCHDRQPRAQGRLLVPCLPEAGPIAPDRGGLRSRGKVDEDARCLGMQGAELEREALVRFDRDRARSALPRQAHAVRSGGGCRCRGPRPGLRAGSTVAPDTDGFPNRRSSCSKGIPGVDRPSCLPGPRRDGSDRLVRREYAGRGQAQVPDTEPGPGLAFPRPRLALG